MFSDAASKTPATWARQSFPKSVSVASLGPRWEQTSLPIHLRAPCRGRHRLSRAPDCSRVRNQNPAGEEMQYSGSRISTRKGETEAH